MTGHEHRDGEDGHSHGSDSHDHHHHGNNETWDAAVLTVTSSREESGDQSGPRAGEALAEAGHDVVAEATVPDDEEAIREAVEEHLTEADLVVTTGGTGLTPDDVTVEAVRPLFDKELPGVGEYFRRLSHEQVGTAAMLSRATAGVVDGDAVYAFPGNPDAVALGVEEVLLPEIDHVLGLARR